MTKLLFTTLLCLLVTLPSTFSLDSDISVSDLVTYNKWRFNNKRVYLNEEEQIYRQTLFFQNLKAINEHSQNTEATYQVAINQFSDMTIEEFQQRILNMKMGQRTHQENRNLAADPVISNKVFPTPPVSVDWRTKGVINPIKDQGQCGSCWTFGSIGVMESFNAIVNKKLEKYSEQQLVDCVHQAGYYSDGCNGGLQDEAVRYSIKYGVLKSTAYPYVGVGGKCKVTKPIASSQGFYPKKFQPIKQDSNSLKSALAFSPVSVSVDASNWFNYYSGIYNGCGKTTTMEQLNHAVIAVGYDAKGNWIIRNSWNTSWGEQGYMRLAAGNTCGVLLDNLVVTE